MKKTLFLSLFLMLWAAVHAQVYDLIVTDKGDSIACRIENIEDAVLYFSMIHNNHWISTNISLNEVDAYEYDVISRSMFIFRQGTSYIESKAIPRSQATTMYEIQKNSVYLSTALLSISLSYERMLPVGNRTGIALAGGISPGIAFTDQGFYFEGKAALLAGGPRHFFETGIMAMIPAETGPFLLAGYRYKAHKGFLIRISAGLNFQAAEDFVLWPNLSLGYSF